MLYTSSDNEALQMEQVEEEYPSRMHADSPSYQSAADSAFGMMRMEQLQQIIDDLREEHREELENGGIWDVAAGEEESWMDDETDKACYGMGGQYSLTISICPIVDTDSPSESTSSS